jgi:hypothetical protein
MKQFSAALLLVSAWVLTAGESAAQSNSAAWTTPSAEQVAAERPERSLEAVPSLSGKRTVHKPLTLINLPAAQRSWPCDRTYGLIAQALYP